MPRLLESPLCAHSCDPTQIKIQNIPFSPGGPLLLPTAGPPSPVAIPAVISINMQQFCMFEPHKWLNNVNRGSQTLNI